MFATDWEISTASSSTERSPWARTSTISALRPLPSARATEESASNRAAFAELLPIIIKLSIEFLKFKHACGRAVWADEVIAF